MSLSLVTAASAASPPHIVFALTDDLGWNYPGYHNDEVSTPTLDHLGTIEGVRLNYSYVYKYCSPTRGSFLSGRLPWKLVSTRCNLIPSTIPEGVDLGYNFLPKHLAKAGYVSWHIGKWHLGFHTTDYTAVGRGFNHSWGFLEGGEDHFTHQCGAAQWPCDVPGTPKKNSRYPDLWTQSNSNFPGSALYRFGNDTKGDEKAYSGYLFTEQAVEAIRTHNTSYPNQPMFMYLALHNTHAPIEAPQRFIDKYHFHDTKKNTFHAMVSVVDETVANITSALKEAGMWQNTVLVWTTDNGSPVQVGGSNHPLRGGKGHNWEGGIRVPGFVTGGVLPSSMKGKTLNGLVHISDWYATFSELAGLGPAADSAGVSPPDSISQWPYLSGATTRPPRTEVVLDHHMFTNASSAYGCRGQAPFEMAGYDALGTIRSGPYKLIVGVESEASWYGEFSPNISAKPDLTASACRDRPCLFDVVADPGEHVDLADDPAKQPIVAELWAKFNKTNSEHHPPILSPKQDGGAFCKALLANKGWVTTPWVEAPV